MPPMKAVRIHSYGSTDNLLVEDAPRPIAGDGELLIRVHATSVNPFDCAARAGYLSGWYPYAFPLVLGLDVSGTVEAVGAGVAGYAVGDAVYARADPARNGAYAEFIALSSADVAPKPPALDDVAAASLPHVGLTAWRALIDAASLTDGQTVLIHAAAGGVGSLAVQLAKARGAKVIGTASSGNLDFVRSLGADEVVDYANTRFEDAVRDVDIVFDTVGGETQERSWAVLKPGGILVSIVQSPSADAAAAHGVRQGFVGAYPPAGDILREISNLVMGGQLKPVVSSVLPLAEIRQAHAQVEGRHVRGKLVLKII